MFSLKSSYEWQRNIFLHSDFGPRGPLGQLDQLVIGLCIPRCSDSPSGSFSSFKSCFFTSGSFIRVSRRGRSITVAPGAKNAWPKI